MIITSDKVEEVEIDNLGFEDESGEVSINQENMAFFYEMMSKNIYSDPIGSIVRELVSNCFDAYKELGTDGVAIVEGCNEEDIYMIKFIDKGVGISPSRWDDTFTKYMSSTKRESNDYLGAFGLGSKSPFAYVDTFYINTVYDGIEYLYMMYKKENGIPGFDTLNTKATDKPNGTIIKFPIEGGAYSDDWHSFNAAIANQLVYFDNVYVKGFGVDNEYKIFDTPLFKYRIGYTGDGQTHVLLGKVKYPIDWKKVGIRQLNIPVGVKFEIGELMVTPNRENLRYTDETVAALKNKLELFIKDIKLRISCGYDTIQEVWEANKDNIRQLKLADGIYVPFSSGFYGYDKKYNTIKWPFEMPKPYLKAFKGIPITIPKNPYLLFRVKGGIKNGRITKKEEKDFDLWHYLNDEKSKPLPLYRTSDFVSNKYKNFKIDNGYLVEEANISVTKIAAALGLFPMKKSPYKKLEKLVGEPIIGEFGNKLSIVKAYKKYIKSLFIKQSESYDRMSISLDDITAYSNNLLATRPQLTRIKGELYVSDLAGTDSSKSLIKEEQLEKCGFIVYGENSSKSNLSVLNYLLSRRYKPNWQKKSGDHIFRVLMVNKKDLKTMEQLKNSFTMEEFILKNKAFVNEITKHFVTPIFKQVEIHPLVLKLCPKIHSLYKDIKANSLDSWEISHLQKTKAGEELLRISKENGWYNKDLVREAEILLKISEDMKIFHNLKESYNMNLTYELEREFAYVLIKKGYRVDPYYTLSLTELEKKWITDWLEQINYIQQVVSDADQKTRRFNHKYQKTIREQVWKSYHKSLMQNKSVKISMLLLATKH